MSEAPALEVRALLPRNLLGIFGPGPDWQSDGWDVVRRSLDVIRKCLAMDSVFIAEHAEGVLQIRAASSPDHSTHLSECDVIRLKDTAIRAAFADMQPKLLANASDLAGGRRKPRIGEMDVGCLIAVPVTLRDGSVFGTLCGIGGEANDTLRPSDLTLLQAIADIAGSEIAKDQMARQNREANNRF